MFILSVLVSQNVFCGLYKCIEFDVLVNCFVKSVRHFIGQIMCIEILADAASDASGVSMNMGSDFEVVDDVDDIDELL